MPQLCKNRVVIVTGAGNGIGRAHALEFARHGAAVVVNDLGATVDGSGASIGPASEVVEQIRSLGGAAVVNGDDVSAEEGAERLVDTALNEFGRLDVLVNNAGILRDRMLVNMTFEEWDAVLRVHLRGTFGPMHFAAKHWRELSKAGGHVDARVVNTTSASGIYGNAGQTNYGAAKAGIAAMTIIAALELAHYGVTVNAIAPGFVDTPLLDETSPAMKLLFIAQTPMGRLGTVDEIAAAALYLASPAADFVTGQVLSPNGGYAI